MAVVSTLDEVLDTIRDINTQQMRFEISTLRAIRDWALRQTGIDFAEGDRVVIAEPLNIGRDSGWWSYRETLAVGQAGVVQKIEFNQYGDIWQASFYPDHEWVVTEWRGERRHWHGPRKTTPDGYEPPSDYEAREYPEGRKHTFSINVKRLRKAATLEQAWSSPTFPRPKPKITPAPQ